MFVAAAAPASAEELIGTWLTANSDAHIRVAKCGKAMCGTVVWLRDAVDPKTGQPPVDDKNPNASLRSRKILGIRIFAMEQDSKRRLDRRHLQLRRRPDLQRAGWCRAAKHELEVQGCAGSLCGSEVWTRAK